MRVDSPLFSEEGPLLTVPAGTVLPYVGMASGSMVAVLVGTTIAYMVRTAGEIVKSG